MCALAGEARRRAVFDHIQDRRLGIRTTGRDYSQLSSQYYGYDATPYPALRRLARSGWVGPDDTLVDYGCGRGRVGIYPHEHTGCRVIGVDRDERRVREAQANLERYGSHGGDPTGVRFVCADAERFDPREATCLYFFNPFSPQVFRGVVNRIANARRTTGRAMRVLFYYTTDEYLAYFPGDDRLVPVGVVDCRTPRRWDRELNRILVFDVA